MEVTWTVVALLLAIAGMAAITIATRYFRHKERMAGVNLEPIAALSARMKFVEAELKRLGEAHA